MNAFTRIMAGMASLAVLAASAMPAMADDTVTPTPDDPTALSGLSLLPADTSERLEATSEVSELGVPIHSRSVKDNGDGTFRLTYKVDGKSNPSVVHLGGDVIVAYDSSGSMGELAAKVKASSSAMASKSLDDPNSSLDDAQQNRVAFMSQPTRESGETSAEPLKNDKGDYWFNDAKTFDKAIEGYNESCNDCDAIDYTAEEAAEIAKTGRATAGSKDLFIITDGGSTDGESSPENLKSYFGESIKDWSFHLVKVNGGGVLDAFAKHAKDAGAKSVEVIDESQMKKAFEKLGADQATSWRVADVSISDAFGPYVDPVDTAKTVVSCVDRKDVEPGEDSTGCDKSPKPAEVKTTWDKDKRVLTVAWPDKGELGAKAQYTVSLDVKVNAAGVTHYEDNGYQYDGVKGATGTGDTAGTEGFPVSVDDKSSVLYYSFNRNGVAQGEPKASPFALPVIHVGKLESTLTYDANGGDGSMAPQTGEHGTSVKAKENGFTRKGYRFTGWSTTKDGRSEVVKPGDAIQLVDKTQTLFAQWSAKPATLSYDKNAPAATGEVQGSEGLDGDTVTVAENAFTWPGRTFTGWNTQPDGSGDTYQPGDPWTLKEGDVVLYAQWHADPSTIAYLPGSDEAAGETEPQSGLVDETVKIRGNGFTWAGHTFLGWRKVKDGVDPDKMDGKTDTKTDATSKDDDSVKDDADSKADAKTDDTSKDDAGVDGPRTSDPDKTVTGSAATREGGVHTIANTDTTTKTDTDTTDGTSKATDDKTTTGDTSTGGTDAADGDTTPKKDAADATSPTGDDTTGDTTTDGDATSTGKSDLIQPGDERKLTIQGETLEAVWRANTYTVRFDANGDGTVGTMTDQTLTYDQPATLNANAYSRVGWTWTNWNTSPDGHGTTYTDKAQVENLTAKDGDTVTLYAQWEKIPLPQTGIAFAGIGLSVFTLIATGALLTVGSKRRKTGK